MRKLKMHTESKQNGAEKSSDIAIIGMACIFPKADDLQTYWQNIVEKYDAITDVPPDRWEKEIFFEKDSSANDRTYCNRGGFLSELAKFNPLDYGIMPIAVDGGDPSQFLALKVAKEALADAGYKKSDINFQRTEIILGRGNYLDRGNCNVTQHSRLIEQTLSILKSLHPEYTRQELERLRQELKASLPYFGPENAPSLIPNITTGRIANRLDLMGANFTVDAACASTLIATELGMFSLLIGKCDLALVGGIFIIPDVPFSIIFCQLGALSRQGKIRPFDKNADGTLIGEGVGVIVMKRLEDAKRDKDRIYAVIKGVGTSSDGRALSVVAPNPLGAELALRRAFSMACLSPKTVSLIEGHGTGTPAGDAAEIEALTRVFGDHSEKEDKEDGSDGFDKLNPAPQATQPKGWCALGTVKSMIGHAMPAAGAAGLIKAALALYHKVLPPTLHCDEPHPKLKNTPFYINSDVRPWIHGQKKTPRRASVNAFGFGGINASVVLEEYNNENETKMISYHRNWETEVCILQGESRQALILKAQHLTEYLKEILSSAAQIHLRDLAYTLNSELGSPPAAYRLAIVASSLEDLKTKLEHALGRLKQPQTKKIKDIKGIYFFEEPLSGKLAFLFPGEGAQYVNMLSDICIHFPEVRACFDEIDAAFIDHRRGYLPSQIIFPPPSNSKEERAEAEKKIFKMDGAIEAVFTANKAMFTLLRRLELREDVILGHSTGEFSSIFASNMTDIDLERIRVLNKLFEEFAAEGNIPEADMVAVGAPASVVSAIVNEIEGDIYVAMDNCPHQVVVVGERKAIQQAIDCFVSKGLFYEKLPFNRAYHTPLFSKVCEHFREFFLKQPISPPTTEIWSCTTMQPYPQDAAEIQRLVADHWMRPVEFSKTIEAMYDAGVRIFVEVGPRGNLTAFTDDILRGRNYLAVASNKSGRSGITQLNHLVGLLTAQGRKMRLDYLYARRAPSILSLDAAVDIAAQEKSASTMTLALSFPSMRISPKKDKREHELEPTESTRAGTEAPSLQTDIVRQVEGLSRRVEPAEILSKSSEQKTEPQLVHPVASPQNDISAEDMSDKRKDSLAFGLQAPGNQNHTPVMEEYFQTMENFLEVQQQVMQAYLTDGQGESSLTVPDSPHLSMGQTELQGPSRGARETKQTEQDISASEIVVVDDTSVDTLTQQKVQDTPSTRGAQRTEEVFTPSKQQVEHLPAEKSDTLPRAKDSGPPSHSSPPVEESPGSEKPSAEKIAQGDDEVHRTLRQDFSPQVEHPDEDGATQPKAQDSALAQKFLNLVSEKTGYPIEMLEKKLSMEADLGIDSIKRIEILGAFSEQYASFQEEVDIEQVASLVTLQQVIDFLEERLGGNDAIVAPPIDSDDPSIRNSETTAPVEAVLEAERSEGEESSSTATSFPFISRIISHIPSVELVAHCQVDLEEDIYLNDHALGSFYSSSGDTKSGLSVIPMTVSMEIMAEAAAILMPSKILIGMKDIRAFQWIKVEEKPVTLQITARRLKTDSLPAKEDTQEVEVQIKNISVREEDSNENSPVVSGTMVYSDAYPEPTRFSKDFSLQSERPPKHTAEEIYKEKLMFHGERFQGVVSIDKCGEDGILGQLQVKKKKEIFRTKKNPSLIIDPFLIDAAGQLVGYWPLEYLKEGFLAFPIRLSELQLYGENPRQGELLECQVRIKMVKEKQLCADIDIIGSNNLLWARLCGWEDWRFYFTPEFFNFFRAPKSLTFSESIISPIASFPASEAFSCYRLDKLEPDLIILEDLWMHLILNRRERETFKNSKKPQEKKIEWLLGRWVAKDAVRMYLFKNHGLQLYPADIEIAHDEHGRPVPQGDWSQKIDAVPALSLAHTDGIAVAIAGAMKENQRVGIDIERIRPLKEGFISLAFSKEEQALLSSLRKSSRQEWVTRFWCAKEAVAKALGRGLIEGPQSLAVQELDEKTGVVKLALSKKLAEEFHQFALTPILAYTAKEEDYIIASSLCEKG